MVVRSDRNERKGFGFFFSANEFCWCKDNMVSFCVNDFKTNMFYCYLLFMQEYTVLYFYMLTFILSVRYVLMVFINKTKATNSTKANTINLAHISVYCKSLNIKN